MEEKTATGESFFMQQWASASNFKRGLVLGFLSLLVVASIIYWIYSQRYVSTEDAYINANFVQISSRITGQVRQLYIKNNQYVTQGQILLEIDQEPFVVAKEKAKAQLTINQTKLLNAQEAAKRVLVLVQKKTLSSQAGDDAIAALNSAAAAVQLAQADLRQADLNLLYTKITAPITGWIANMTLQRGNVVAANEPLFALIDKAEFWVDTNFKETELAHVKPGQKARVEVDMYPGHIFMATVESISRGSGTAFALLPAQNASGNWVKITQRVPVRVKILRPDERYPLRIGTSATVTIDTNSVK